MRELRVGRGAPGGHDEDGDDARRVHELLYEAEPRRVICAGCAVGRAIDMHLGHIKQLHRALRCRRAHHNACPGPPLAAPRRGRARIAA